MGRVHDDEVNSSYWYNARTGEATWIPPEEYVAISDPNYSQAVKMCNQNVRVQRQRAQQSVLPRIQSRRDVVSPILKTVILNPSPTPTPKGERSDEIIPLKRQHKKDRHLNSFISSFSQETNDFTSKEWKTLEIFIDRLAGVRSFLPTIGTPHVENRRQSTRLESPGRVPSRTIQKVTGSQQPRKPEQLLDFIK